MECFYTALAQVTDFWDFSYSSGSFEPRYFYDTTQFRNCGGEMIAAKICGDDSLYVPEDFGHYVTADTVDAYMESYWDVEALEESTYTAQVPILLYHHLDESPEEGSSSMSVEGFEAQIAALAQAGYTAVDFTDLYNYVVYGQALPDKPVVITFDDGYESNYTYAYPILQKYGMKATIFVIGVSVGKDTYKDTGVAMTVHFTWEQAAEMEASGLISIESHGYNFHEVSGRDEEPVRYGILMREGETEAEYISFLNDDFETMAELFTEHLGKTPTVLAFPYGAHDTLSDILAAENGALITLTTVQEVNTLVQGLPQSL
ncbi:MAG: polysaccharide deacetylase family protein [Oscillospiraceae bacterium]|nr:polysaccharide deacetylase family protein [Oscillospiraceae bacterium]